MTLDLYYSNFTNVGDALEKMYQTFLMEDMKLPKAANVENGKTVKAADNGRVQASLERMAISKRQEEPKRSQSARNLKVQIKKPEPFRTGPVSPSVKNSPVSPMRYSPASQRNNPPSNLRHTSASPMRSGPSQQKPRHRSPQKPSTSQRNAPQSPSRRHYPQSPPQSPPYSPQKKTSPQDLRSKKSSPPANGHSSTSRSPHSANDRTKLQSTNSVDHRDENATAEVAPQTGTDENVLRQQNSRSSTPSSTTPGKCKQASSKVYFREENVENLTWNGDTSFDGDLEDPDASTSPKVNPYSSSFLNFLSSN